MYEKFHRGFAGVQTCAVYNTLVYGCSYVYSRDIEWDRCKPYIWQFNPTVTYWSCWFILSSNLVNHVYMIVNPTLFFDFRATGRYSTINSTEPLAWRVFDVGKCRLMSQVGRVHVNPCVSAVIAAEVPVFVCLRSSCNRDWGRKTVSFVRHALKLVMQNDVNYVDVTLIYLNIQKVLCFSPFLITTGILVSVVKNRNRILLRFVFSLFYPYVLHYYKIASCPVSQNIPASPPFALSFGSFP